MMAFPPFLLPPADPPTPAPEPQNLGENDGTGNVGVLVCVDEDTHLSGTDLRTPPPPHPRVARPPKQKDLYTSRGGEGAR